jgi:hypothetical protein
MDDQMRQRLGATTDRGTVDELDELDELGV